MPHQKLILNYVIFILTRLNMNKIFPEDIIDMVNDFSITSISTDVQIYNTIKRINPNFSLQMEYQSRMLREGRHIDRTVKSILINTSSVTETYELVNKYCSLRDVPFSIEYMDMGWKHCYIISSNEIDKVRDILGDEFECKDDKIIIDDENNEELILIMEFLFKYMSLNEEGYIFLNQEGEYVFELTTPELQYCDVFSQQLVDIMKKDGISLYDICVEQQRIYGLTKIVPNDIVSYIGSNRHKIKTVIYNRKDNIIMIDDYPIHIGNIDLFKGIVALLHHPMNIIQENYPSNFIEQEYGYAKRAYKYYTLDTLF